MIERPTDADVRDWRDERSTPFDRAIATELLALRAQEREWPETAITEQICFDAVVRQRDSARALLREALPWVTHMCGEPPLDLCARIAKELA